VIDLPLLPLLPTIRSRLETFALIIAVIPLSIVVWRSYQIGIGAIIARMVLSVLYFSTSIPLTLSAIFLLMLKEASWDVE